MTSQAVTADGRARVLADGNEMPMLGLGVWQVPDGPECVNAVRWALELGYRHIDTAQAYGNEESVGQGAARQRSGARVRVRHDEVLPGAQRSRRRGREQPPKAGHRPGRPVRRALAAGWRHVGVAGHGARARARPRPLDRSLEFQRRRAGGGERRGERRAGRRSGAVQPVRVPARAARGVPAARRRARGLQPAGDRPPLAEETVTRIAQQLGRTPAQVLLRWCLQHELVVIPKSTHRERIEENAQVFDFALSDADMAQLDALDGTAGTDQAREGKWW